MGLQRVFRSFRDPGRTIANGLPTAGANPRPRTSAGSLPQSLALGTEPFAGLMKKTGLARAGLVTAGLVRLAVGIERERRGLSLRRPGTGSVKR